MVRTVLTALDPKGPYEVISAGDLDFIWDASDTSNGNDFILTGDQLILVHNDDAGTQTITFTSVLLNGRTGDITTYSLAADDYAVFYPNKIPGWKQADGKLWIATSDNNVRLKIINV